MIDSYGGQVKYQEPLLLFHNDGKRLANVSKEAGPVFAKTFPARGLAIGDFDNDGRVDVLVGNNGEAPVLLQEQRGGGQPLAGPPPRGQHAATATRSGPGSPGRWAG